MITLFSRLRSGYRHGIQSLHDILRSLSITGKIIFAVFATLFVASSIFMLFEVNNSFLVAVPRIGGTLTEGVIGQPRFINPLLAVTDADNDLAALIYSGLMRHDTEGKLIPDLAERFTVSEDGKMYDFFLRNNATFHDGKPVTADDIVFTIGLIQNPNIQSPHLSDWAGVKVQKISDKQIRFILLAPYVPFLENTTIGILPKHLWQTYTSPDTFPLANINVQPVGSGPYKMYGVKKGGDNMALSYTLVPFKNFVLGTPYISTLVINFYSDQRDIFAAYTDGTLDMFFGIPPQDAGRISADTHRVTGLILPRIFGVFFNQENNEALADSSVREALDLSVDRGYIVNTVLQGFASPITDPVPYTLSGTRSSTSSLPFADRLKVANELLDSRGWLRNSSGIREKKLKTGTSTLAFSITTSDAPELKEVAEIVKKSWKEIGADVSVKIFEGAHLHQNIIKPRRYEALLFGQVVNQSLDLYPFWHSSQIDDPGLNISRYANDMVDSYLVTLRSARDEKTRLESYQKIKDIISKEHPAIFLYSPKLVSVMPLSVQNVSAQAINTPSDRLSFIHTWYIETDKLWKIFVK